MKHYTPPSVPSVAPPTPDLPGLPLCPPPLPDLPPCPPPCPTCPPAPPPPALPAPLQVRKCQQPGCTSWTERYLCRIHEAQNKAQNKAQNNYRKVAAMPGLDPLSVAQLKAAGLGIHHGSDPSNQLQVGQRGRRGGAGFTMV